MSEDVKPAPAASAPPRLLTELDYLYLIEKHLNTIKQIIVFLLIVNVILGVMQLCNALAAMAGITLY